MAVRSKYKTKQRKLLLDYFRRSPGEHITAGDVCAYLKSQGSAIGLSTVYRQLESLVDEGLLQKYIIDSNTPACFEYVGMESHEECGPCYHCKCEKCGRLIHLKCGEVEQIQQHLFTEHQFKLNPLRTVFYGICQDCYEKSEQ